MSSFRKNKRGSVEGSSPSKKGTSSSSRSEGIDGLEFEDPYADEFEEEEYDDAAIEKEGMEDYEGDGDDEATKDEDSDEDGIGDACDQTPFGQSTFSLQSSDETCRSSNDGKLSLSVSINEPKFIVSVTGFSKIISEQSFKILKNF